MDVSKVGESQNSNLNRTPSSAKMSRSPSFDEDSLLLSPSPCSKISQFFIVVWNAILHYFSLLFRRENTPHPFLTPKTPVRSCPLTTRSKAEAQIADELEADYYRWCATLDTQEQNRIAAKISETQQSLTPSDSQRRYLFCWAVGAQGSVRIKVQHNGMIYLSDDKAIFVEDVFKDQLDRQMYVRCDFNFDTLKIEENLTGRKLFDDDDETTSQMPVDATEERELDSSSPE